jgi:rod shape-determining protein MreD
MTRRPHRRRVQPLGAKAVALDIARLAALMLVAFLLQTTVSPHVRILGASPDFALLAVVCVSLLRGAEIGAVFGFIMGLLVSVALLSPLGVSSFIFVVIGYLAGRYAETADTSSWLAPVFTVLVCSLLAELLSMLIQFLLDRQVPLGYVVTRLFIPAIVLNTLLAAPVYLLARLWLREGVSGHAAAA